MITKDFSNSAQCHLLILSNSFVIFSTWVLWIKDENPPQKYPPQKYPPWKYSPQKYPPQKYPPQKYPPRKYLLSLWKRSSRWYGQIVIFSTWVLQTNYESPPQKYPPRKYPPRKYTPWKYTPWSLEEIK